MVMQEELTALYSSSRVIRLFVMRVRFKKALDCLRCLKDTFIGDLLHVIFDFMDINHI